MLIFFMYGPDLIRRVREKFVNFFGITFMIFMVFVALIGVSMVISIRPSFEKYGGLSVTISMTWFPEFIRSCEQKDITISNAQFTWSVSVVLNVITRIDCFLLINNC